MTERGTGVSYHSGYLAKSMRIAQTLSLGVSMSIEVAITNPPSTVGAGRLLVLAVDIM